MALVRYGQFTGVGGGGDGDTLGALTPTKGALAVGNGASWTLLAPDTDSKILSLNSLQATGLQWIAQPSGGGINNVVEDTTPQLGGALDVNGFKLVSVANGDIDIEPNGTGNVLLGNFTFNADQVVGAGEDNYVLTYDHASGTIGLEVAPGAGGGINNLVEDATPQLGGMLDVNGFALGDGTLELLKFSETASAVNELTITNAATGNMPMLSATGDDANIGLWLAPKGTGNVRLGNFTFDGDQTVGAGQDNYVLTYDNATGLVSLEAAGGGSSQWTTNGNDIYYNTGGIGLGISSVPSTLYKAHFHNSAGGGNYSALLKFSNVTRGTTATDGFDIGVDLNNVSRIWDYDGNNMIFGTFNAERMKIFGTGAVAVGPGVSAANNAFVVTNSTGTNYIQVGTSLAPSATDGAVLKPNALEFSGASTIYSASGFSMGIGVTGGGGATFSTSTSSLGGTNVVLSGTYNGVGGFSTNYKFYVNGSISYDPGTYAGATGNTTWSTGLTPAVSASIGASGAIIGAGMYSVSDERLKTNIVDMDSAMAASFMALVKPKTFNWIEDNKFDSGFTAQQLLHAGFPHLVSAIPDADRVEVTNADGVTSVAGERLIVNYDAVIPILCKAIQDLMARVAALETP